jgi:hypothetical protein
MTFFYDLNKKLDSIRATPEVTHKQLNERDMGKHNNATTGFKAVADKAAKEYGSKAAGERVAGAVKAKMAKAGKLEEEQVDEVVRAGVLNPTGGGGTVLNRPSTQGQRDALAKQIKNVRADTMNPAKRGGTSGKTSNTIYTAKQVDHAGDWTATPKARDGKGIASGPTMAEAGVLDTVKKVGKKVASGINKLVGHGSDEEMRKDLQRKSGAPVTGKKPQQRSMKEANNPGVGYSPEMQERIKMATPKQLSQMAYELAGDPSHYSNEYKKLEATQSWLKGTTKYEESSAPMTAKQKSFAKLAPPEHKITFADKIAGAKKEVDEMLGDVAAEAMRSALGGGRGRNAEMDEERSKGTAFDMSTPRAATPKVGSVERGHKHDIKHTATGRMVTRRVDDQGNSVGADDDSAASGEKRGRGRPKGTKQSIGAKGPSGRSKLMTKEGADQGQAQQVVNDLAELRAIAKQSQRGGEFPQGFASQLEVVLYAAITLIRNQQSGDAQVREEEKTSTRDDHAEKAGKKVTKDIEYDEKKKDGIHGKKRGAEDDKAEKAGKKVTKDIEYDEKKKDKKEEEVDESTTSGSVATSTATKSSKGGVFGKGIYDSMNRELENMIAESLSINMSDSTEGNKSLTVTATDDDAMKLAMILKSAGLGGQGGDMHSHGEEPCATCGMPDCGCGDVQEAVDENAPDWPTNTETSSDALQYAGGLNKPKTDVAGDGQTTIPNTAVHTQDEDALRRMMEMAGVKQAELEPWERTMKEDAEEDVTDAENAVNDAEAAEDEMQEGFLESIQRMREMAGIKEAKKATRDWDKDGKLETGAEEHAGSVDNAIKKAQAEKKVDESIFALTNQWRAYKG